MAGHLVTVLATAISGLAFSGLWFVLPLLRRRREIAKP
jgi:hypothetical protein